MSTLKRNKGVVLISVLLCTVLVLGYFLIFPKPNHSLQLKSGTLLQYPLDISPFILESHTQQSFTLKDLKGSWHILSYGYTHCPDICPNTLLALSQLHSDLQDNNIFKDVNFLFYTIDPERDSIKVLSKYVPYFGSSFVGLRKKENVSIISFEEGLGIKSIITKSKKEKEGDYRVSHGVDLYLINPQAKLHAVFHPVTDPFGNKHFDLENLLSDYLNIRHYAETL